MTVILAAPIASPAVAADELGLSLDGIHWKSSISTPLFDPSFRWVPGDSETATFYVRNQGGSLGDLTVDVLGPTADGLIESGDLHVTAKGGGGKWTNVSEPGHHRLLTAPDIADGTVSAIKVNVSFDSSSTNSTQLRASKLTFRITLSESTAAGRGENLPGTGAPRVLLLAVLSALSIGSGLSLATGRNEAIRGVPHV